MMRIRFEIYWNIVRALIDGKPFVMFNLSLSVIFYLVSILNLAARVVALGLIKLLLV